MPGKIERAEASRELLVRYQIDINDAVNGVPLVGGKGAPQDVLPRRHRGNGLHTEATGIRQLNDRLAQAVDGVEDWATGRQRIIDELEVIASQILDGTFPF